MSGARRTVLTLLAGALVVLSGCRRYSAATHALDSATPGAFFSPPVPLGLDAFSAIPEDNPLTAEKVALGRRLFGDPVLSFDRSRACASCHRPALAFADSVPISAGVQGRRVSRNAPTLLNRTYGTRFFWDGRAASLEDAVLRPIENPNELALSIPALLERLRSDAGYRAGFRGAFPNDEITRITLSYALASYVRALRAGDAPVDRYVAGDSSALKPAARRGRRLFLGKGGCADCHSGPTFTDERFHNTGIAVGTSDDGRYAITRETADHGRFKTPTLRHVAQTAPYMHDGSLPTLERVLAFYDSGGRANPNLDADIRPLHLTASEKADLVAFLRALGDRAKK